MPTGTVKWFNEDKLRLHHAGRGGPRPVRPPVRVAADGPLKEGARVSFGAEQGDKGPKAVNVREL
jgi:cold shock CspA family protein